MEGWWSPQVVAEPKVGSTLQATFHGGSDHQFVIKMEVVSLEPARKVEWIPQQGAPEWSGTHITWDLAPVDRVQKSCSVSAARLEPGQNGQPGE